uniref:Uncharacterized protein n=1 Tax=Arundo donax TaxID=35708 RepID=A0A0A9BQJ7_ARUDO
MQHHCTRQVMSQTLPCCLSTQARFQGINQTAPCI